MSLDGELEIAVYIHNFHNLDLFQQGWYGLKVTCFWEEEGGEHQMGLPSRVVQYAVPDVQHGEASTFWQINDADSSYHTRPFRVRFSRQDIRLQEMVSFKLRMTQERPMDHGVIVQFELLYAPLEQEPARGQPPDTLPTVATHSFRIVGGVWSGLHTFCPLTFDAWHFVFVEVNVHSVLLSFNRGLLPPKRATPDATASADGGEEEKPQEWTKLDLPSPPNASAPGGTRTNQSWLGGTAKVANSSSEEGKGGNGGVLENGTAGGGDKPKDGALDPEVEEAGDPGYEPLPRNPNWSDLELLHLLLTAKERLTEELQIFATAAEASASKVKVPLFELSAAARKLQARGEGGFAGRETGGTEADPPPSGEGHQEAEEGTQQPERPGRMVAHMSFPF